MKKARLPGFLSLISMMVFLAPSSAAAAPAVYTIQGYVRGSETIGIGGVVLRGFPGDPVTNTGGYYSVTVQEGWSGTIIPEHPDYVCEPLVRSYTNVAESYSSQDYSVSRMASLYVDAGAGGLETGLSWGDAKRRIQDAVDLAVSLSGGKIFVAEGTYRENIVLNAGQPVQLYGGYPAGGGKRDTSRFISRIDSQNSGRAVRVGGMPGVIIDGFTITGGNAAGGGATDGYGGGVYCDGNRNTVVLRDCLITGNTASANGGGVFIRMSNLWFIRCRITNNTAGSLGGGVCFFPQYSYPAFTGCVISGNYAVGFGGGVYSGDYSNYSNCTIVNNRADMGGGGIYSPFIYYPTVVNSIIYFNTSGQIQGNSLQISYSCVQGGFTGEGNTASDPRLDSNGYSLLPDSPCIDAGNNIATAMVNRDIDGEQRIDATRVDIGADEYIGPPIVSFEFEESGAVARDSSGNGNDGNVIGAQFVPAGGVEGSNAYVFSRAEGDTVVVPYRESQDVAGRLTVEAWIKPFEWIGLDRFVSKQASFHLRAWVGHANFILLTGNNGFQYVEDFATPTLCVNRWHYIVGTFDGSVMRLYVDGALRKSTFLPSEDTIAVNSRPISVGECDGLGEGFNGIIDKVAVSRTVKSADSILQTYREFQQNSPPIAVDDAANAAENSSVVVNAILNDSDADVPCADQISIRSVGLPSNGTAVVVSGRILYTPRLHFQGSDSFDYTIWDAAGISSTASVVVTVIPLLEPPMAVDDDSSVTENGSMAVDVLANDIDYDAPYGSVLTIQSVTSPSHGTAVIGAGTITYTPSPHYSGTDGFTYTIVDSQGLPATAAVNLIVEFVPSPPNAPSSLLTDGRLNPNNVSRYAPVFSWTFTSPDQADPTGDEQTAFQIRIGTSPGGWDDWDSLKVVSGFPAAQYSGAGELSPNTRYYWSVRVWNRSDLAGNYSGGGEFEILDIGLRVFDGVETARIAVDYAGADTPLRIYKGGVTYGILLVDPSDPRASRVRIQTRTGIKAFKKM